MSRAFSLSLRDFLFFRSAKPPLSPPFHPHSYERFSLGASWVFLIQQVLLSSTRPLLPFFVREVWASRQSQSPELGGRARLFGYKTYYAAARITFWLLRSGS